MRTSLVAIVIIVFLLSNVFRWGFDSTDDLRPDKMFGKRSGLSLYTDHQTGVQYVKGGIFGATTPRVDKDGNIIIVKGK